ncbi:MAG: hypothetical protein HQM10_26200 [Candidatus Riflebacteria bacterium]|nr:hypothetical protein [Candidatus Riflebacteria bacterium]
MHSRTSSSSSADSAKYDVERFLALAATVFLIFFFTRSAPFPTGTFWDLASARDFDLNLGWVILPETIALTIAQSSASLLGLKVLYHIIFFLICCILIISIFQGREILPGILILLIFAAGIQPLLSFRWLIQLLFLSGLLVMLQGNFLNHAFGIVLIPITAAASGLGLATWPMIVLIVFHGFFRQKFRPTLVICSLLGMLFFPEGVAAYSNGLTDLSGKFQSPKDLQAFSLLSGVFLLPNLLSIPIVKDEDIPTLMFYSVMGITSLVYPSYMPAFVLTGVFLLISTLREIEPLNLNVRIAGLAILALMIHLLVFLNPQGFMLNPSIREDSGSAFESVLSCEMQKMRVPAYCLGEYMWKGVLTLSPEELAILRPNFIVPLTLGRSSYYLDTSDITPGS